MKGLTLNRFRTSVNSSKERVINLFYQQKAILIDGLWRKLFNLSTNLNWVHLILKCPTWIKHLIRMLPNGISLNLNFKHQTNMLINKILINPYHQQLRVYNSQHNKKHNKHNKHNKHHKKNKNNNKIKQRLLHLFKSNKRILNQINLLWINKRKIKDKKEEVLSMSIIKLIAKSWD